MPASVRENLALVAAPSYTRGPVSVLRSSPLREAVAEVGRLVKLTGLADDRQPVRTLSGGNQQKVVLGKWLLNEPQVLILDEPTRGIDVAARYEIYRWIDQFAAGGAGVLVISSEIEELIGICDRILVMSQGEIRDELARDAFDAERILHSALQDSATQARVPGEDTGDT